MCTPGQWRVNPSAIAAIFGRIAFQEVVFQFLQALPVGHDIVVVGLLREPPDGVGDRPLDDHAHPALAGQRQRQIDGLLVGDVERCLQRVEGTAADGVAGGLVVAGIADVARVSHLAGTLECGDDVTLAQLGLRATMKLNQVDAVGAQPLEAAADALEQRVGPPVLGVGPFGVPALGEQEELAAA